MDGGRTEDVDLRGCGWFVVMVMVIRGMTWQFEEDGGRVMEGRTRRHM